MHLKDLGNLINTIDEYKKVGAITDNINTVLSESFKNLSASEIIAKTATMGLTDKQKFQLIQQYATDKANYATITSLNTLSASEGIATGTTGGLSAAFRGLGASIKSFIVSNPVLAIATIATVAVAAGAAIYTKLHPALEKAVEDLKEQKQSFDEVSKEVSDLSNELEIANNKIDELQSKGSLSLVENEELSKLKETTTELETQLAIKKEEQRLEAKKTADAANKAFNGVFRSKYDDNGDLIGGDAVHSNDAVKELENSIKAYYKLQEEYNITKKNADFFIRESEKNGGRYSATGKVDYRQYEKYAKQMKSLDKQMDSASTQAHTMYEAINGQKEAYEGLADAGYTLNQEQLMEYQVVRQSSENYRNFCADINDTAKSFAELDNAQKRSSLEAEFVLRGLDDQSAKEIIESLDDEDLDIVATMTARFDSSSTQESVQKAIEEAQAEAQGITIKSEISTFEQAWSSSFTSENDKVKELGNTLLELAEKGRLTTEAFNKADSTAYFKHLGISAEEAVFKINKMVDESKQLSSMSDQISSMADTLGTKKSDGFVSANALSGFDAEVRGLDSWDRFQEVLGSTASSYEDCEKAANALATEWVNSSDFLAQLTDENKEYYESQLKAMGVENYKEVIAYIQELNSAKESAEGITLNTSADCENLLTLAQNAGVTGNAITLLAQLIEIYNNLANGTYGTNAQVIDAVKNRAETLKNQLNDIFTNGTNHTAEIDPQIKVNPTTKTSASNAGKAAGDAYVDAFEEELSELEQLKDDGVITEKEYLDRLRALNEQYFKDKLGYEKQFSKYQRQYLEGYKSLYESALSGITKLMSSRIDGYTESKDAAIESLEAEKQAAEDAYQSQIDAIDDMIDRKKETIDSIRDEIDAMKEAREERKREIDLQKAQYDLERMKNQRTILQYSEERGLHYVSDESGIRDAKEAVDDAKFEIEVASKEKEIRLLEDEIDLLEKQKNSLAEAQEASNKYYDSLIKQQEEYWDSMIRSMEQQKSKWEELAEIEGIADAYSKVKQVFNDLGYSVEDVLNGNKQAFEDFKSKYITLLSNLNNNEGFTEGLSFATGIKEAGAGIDELASKAGSLSSSTESIGAIAGAFTEMGLAAKDMADALGTEGEEAGGLVGALKSLSDLSLSLGEIGTNGKATGILAQFQNLKGAVDAVTNAITGGGAPAAESGDASNSSSPSMSTDAGNQTGGGLTGAINSIQDTTKTVLSGGAGSGEKQETPAEGAGVIGQFGLLQTAVNNVTDAIGSEDDKDNKKNTLISALRAQYNAALEVLPEEKGLFDELLSSISECANVLSNMANSLNMFSAIDLSISGGNGGGSPALARLHAEGTVGNAFAEGTDNYKGLSQNEKYALRSEYGQPELTVYPDGTTELTTSPIMSSLPKGTVIFNEKQTRKIMNNKAAIKGNAYADGTDSEGWITTPSGERLRPLQPGDKSWDMLQKFNAYMSSIDNNVAKLSANIMQEQSRQMNDAVNQIRNGNIANSGRPGVNIGYIQVTCPGVTSQQVAEQLGNVIGKELDKQFNGFHNYVDQMSRIR